MCAHSLRVLWNTELGHGIDVPQPLPYSLMDASMHVGGLRKVKILQLSVEAGGIFMPSHVSPELGETLCIAQSMATRQEMVIEASTTSRLQSFAVSTAPNGLPANGYHWGSQTRTIYVLQVAMKGGLFITSPVLLPRGWVLYQAKSLGIG